jgi:hypothetical protein
MAIKDNIVSYYKLESDGSDSVGSNTLTGTSPSFSTGKIGNGGAFTAASSHYLNGSSFAGASSWSCNFWFNPTTNIDTEPVSKDDVSTKRIFSFSFSATQTILYAWGTGQNFHQTTGANHNMSTGTWYMWTGVWDAPNNVLTLYKNGSSFATFSLSGNESADTTSNNLTLGRQNGGVPARYTNGKLDEVGVWSRALTSAEVTSLYNSGNGLQYPFDLTAQLASYWKLDESSGNASDSVGSVTLTNNGTTAYVAGKINNSADFGSSGTAKSLRTTNTLGIDGGSCTFSCWVNKNTNLTSGKYTNGAYQNNTTSKVEYRLGIDNGGGTELVNFTRGKTGTADNNAQETLTMTVGTWYHLVGTYDGTNVKLYRDGVLKATTASSGNGSTAPYTAGFSIGNNNDSSSFIQNSLIVDEVGVWTRALTASEITSLYNAGAGVAYPFYGTAYSMAVTVGTFTLTGVSALFHLAWHLVATVQIYTLTGIAATFRIGKGLVAGVGSFILTGINAVLRNSGWTNSTKNTSTWTEKTKNSSSWTNRSKTS